LWKASPCHDPLKNSQPPKSPPHRTAEPLLHSARCPTPQALPIPSSSWDHQIHTPLVPLPLRPRWAPALQACLISAPPGPWMAGHHRRALNLPKRHRQTGLDAKGVTSELQDCNSTVPEPVISFLFFSFFAFL
jgi:hypothetical protein